MMLTLENTVLVIIDVQVRIAQAMYEKEILLKNLMKLIRGALVLGIPIIATEQNPEKLGPTETEIAQLLPKFQAIPKLSFSCCGEKRFWQELETLNRKQVLIAGIETHVCVYQTVMDLLSSGYEVQVVADAVSSRAVENREIGLKRMVAEGAHLTSTETVLFELLRVAKGDKFREISRIVK